MISQFIIKYIIKQIFKMDIITKHVRCDLLLNKYIILNKWFFIPYEEEKLTDVLHDGKSTLVCSTTSKKKNYHAEWRYYKDVNKYKLLYVPYNEVKKIVKEYNESNYINELSTIGEVIIYCATTTDIDISQNSLNSLD